MNAPTPTLTSSTMRWAPAAIFLLMIEDAIKGSASTVPVTSRKAYNLPSAGARSPVCPVSTKPTSLSWSRNSSLLKSVRKPGIDSILSSVPPLKPRPCPDILPTRSPQAETIGSTTSVVLSPTPPVECLSKAKSTTPVKSRVSPDSAMARVSSVVSLSVIPFRSTAIAQAEAW